MSEAAKAARSAMKSKAERLTKADPSQKVDSSTWSPPEALDADVKTGARPLVKRLYKKGGKVIGKAAGEASKARADRVARKSGGRIGKEAEDRSKRYLTPDNLINRDVRMANEAREGKKHVGAFGKGGKAKKAMYEEKLGNKVLDSMPSGEGNYARQKGVMPVEAARAARAAGDEGKIWGGSRKLDGLKRGGKAFPDLTGDGKVTKADVLKGRGVIKTGGKVKKLGGGPIGDNPISAQSREMGKAAGMMKKGGAAKKAHGGSMEQDRTPRNIPAQGGMVPASKAQWKRDLDADSRAAAPTKSPDYPDKAQSLPRKKGGKVANWEGSKKDEAQDRMLAKKYGISMEKWEKSEKDKKHDKQQSMEGLKKGGRTAKYSGGGVFSGDSLTKIPGAVGGREAHAKGGKAKKGKTNINIVIAAGGKPVDGAMPNAPVPAPRGVPVPPPMPGAAMPAGGMPPMPPMPPQGGMPMPRKSGGRTTHVIDHAAGGGLGRMEKIKAYGHKAGKVVGKVQ